MTTLWIIFIVFTSSVYLFLPSIEAAKKYNCVTFPGCHSLKTKKTYGPDQKMPNMKPAYSLTTGSDNFNDSRLGTVKVIYSGIYQQSKPEFGTEKATELYVNKDGMKPYLREILNTTQVSFPYNYKFKFGLHKMTIELEPRTQEGAKYILDKHRICYFDIKPKKAAKVNIIGSHELSVSPKSRNITLEAIVKVELINPPKDFFDANRDCIYEWSCKQDPPNEPNYCTNWTHHGRKATFPQSSLLSDLKFNFTVSGALNHYPKEKSYDQTRITVKSGGLMDLDIKCLKNCPPYELRPDSGKKTVFKVECVAICAAINDTKYKWDMKYNNTDGNWIAYTDAELMEITDMEPHGTTLDVMRSTVKYTEMRHRLTVSITDNHNRKGTTYFDLDFPEPPMIVCTVTPDHGISLRTNFSLHCNLNKMVDPKIGNEIRFYKDNLETKEKIVVFTDKLPATNRTFTLPPSTEKDNYYVSFSSPMFGETKIWPLGELSKTTHEPIPQKILVRALFENETNPEKISNSIHDNYHEHRTKINATNPVEREKSLNAIASLVHSLGELNITNPVLNSAIEELQTNIINDANSAVTFNTADMFKILHTIDKAVKLNEPEEIKPEMFDLTQQLCEKISLSKLELVQQKNHPHDDEHDVASITKQVTACTSMNSKPNPLLTKMLDVNVTTAEPTITVKNEKVIVENYEDYKDFQDKYFDHLNAYESGTKRVVRTSLVSAKTIALTMSVGEKLKKMNINQNQLLVAKDLGKILYPLVYESGDINLTLSADWKYSDHRFDILMATWTKDIVWYNINKTELNSNIVAVEFWHSSCRDAVLTFKDPFSLLFKVKSVIHWPVEIEVGKELTVRRIYLDSQQQLRIMFKKLDADDVIKVLILINEYPSKLHNDYEQEITISQNASMVNYVNRHKTPLYLYLSFETKLPKNIEIEFSTSYCLTYMFGDFQWIRANETCRMGATSDDEHVKCECHKNFTVLAVVVHPIVVLNTSEILTDFQLELISNPIIPLTVFILITIYSLILCMYFMKQKDNIYFLTDNNVHNNYVYFVIVQTGTSVGSGTSSNIIIKLTGEEGATEPHLLNYPDPQMKMLQKGNRDCYVITTKKSLGEIKQLEIWFDSIGFKPSWNCQDVWVYDFKKGNEWLFIVNKKLNVLNDVVLLTVEPEKKVKNVKYCNCDFQMCDYTHGWTISKTDGKLSFVRKVSILLSNWLMTMMIAMFLYGLPLFELRDAFDNNISFYYQFSTFLYGVIAGGISFGVHFGIAWSLRIINTSKAKWLEAFTSFFECSIVVLIVISFGFLMTFGPFVPYYRSLYVLASTATGLFISGVLFENVLIFLRTLLFKAQWKYNIGDKYRLLLNAIKEQRAFLYKTFGANLLRPYFSHLYKPMDRLELEERKLITLKRRDYLEDFKDIFWFGIYILLLLGVIILNKSALSVTSNLELMDLMEGTLTRSYRFSDLTSAKNVYVYLEHTLIPALQSTHWYGNFVQSDPGLTNDMNNKYLGIVRMRQHRMPKNLCNVPKLMAYTNMTCWPEFNFIYAETRIYAPKWNLFSNVYRFYRLNEMFQYANPNKTETFSTVGSFATYPGGGYISFLGRSLHNSIANLQEIIKKGWIDENTRGLFIEFLLYSTNHNQFNAVTMLLEQSASGYVHKRIMVQTATMLYTADQMATIKIVLLVVFLAWVGMLFLKKSAGIVERLKTFFKDLWNYVDFFIIIVSVLCIGTTMIRTRYIEVYLEDLEASKHNEFVNYFILFYLEDFVIVFAAMLVSVATLRLWRFLRFAKIFQMMERTLVLARSDLTAVTIVFTVLLMAFGFSGRLLYGNSFSEFKSIYEAFHTLSLSVIFPTLLVYDDFIAVTKIAYFFYGFYLVVALLIKSLFVVALMEAYKRAQRQFADRIDVYTLKTYVYDRIRYIRKKLKYDWKRLRAGATKKRKEPEVVTLKSGENRFENCASIHSDRMELMKHLIKCLVTNTKVKKSLMMNKKKTKMTTTTFKQMFRVAWHFFHKMIHTNLQWTSDKVETDTIKDETFYMGHLGEEKLKFVDEKRILLMKSITEGIFKRKKKVREKGQVSKIDENVLSCMKIVTENNLVLKKTDLRMSLLVEKLAKETRKMDQILK